jgi:undecaprenyl-diphosphatase
VRRPTLGVATLYKLFSAFQAGQLTPDHLPLLAVGTVAAFVVSYLSIVWLLRFVSTHSFRVFGVYRIIAGTIIVGLALLAAQIFQ